MQEFPSLGASSQNCQPSADDFPSVGGGIPRFAGRREPPLASHAPSPPLNWSSPKQKPTIHDVVRLMEEVRIEIHIVCHLLRG